MLSTSKKIDVTMTSVLRPGIVNVTLKSFCEKFLTDRSRYRLIINIDPVGENVKPKEVVKVCENYFDEVIYNVPNEPSFPAAVIWTWRKARSEWIFHLEDDWLISRDTSINHMISILERHQDFACLRMPKHRIPNKRAIMMFRSRYRYNPEGFYVADDRKAQFGLNPVLIRGSFVKRAVPLMITTKNPEKQFRYGNILMREFIMKWNYAIYGTPGSPALAIDNGLTWRQTLGFNKPTPEEGPFLAWKKK